MDRRYYLDLAAAGLRMPIATDLVLAEHDGVEEILHDGRRLAEVMLETAERFAVPLALLPMDLKVEKRSLLTALDVPENRIDTWHVSEPPDGEAEKRLARGFGAHLHERLRANLDALRAVAADGRKVPVGMVIGPFSLTTKLLADPITPVFLAGSGVTPKQDEDVQTLQAVLALATEVVLRTLDAQIGAGARAVFVCEPAANTVYLSPNQIASGSDVFERYVMAPNRLVAERLARGGADLILHNCGELTDHMVSRLASLRPVILSLGSSRRLWEDARLVPKDVVLFGNLPSKQFFSDQDLCVEEVTRRCRELRDRMREAAHPFILASECDILSVPGREAAIAAKVRAMMTA